MKSSVDISEPRVHRVLIVDDHPVLCQGLAQMLEAEDDLSVPSTAGSAAEAIAILSTSTFDLAIIDISLRGLSGMDLLQDLKIRWPKMPVLVYSIHDEAFYAERALKVGARGYVMKLESCQSVLGAIRRVLSGCLSLSEAMNSRMLTKALQGGRDASMPGSAVDLLSNRELEVFQMIGRGLGTRAVAEKMHIGVKTVDTHRAHIKQKLGLSTTLEVVRAAFEWIKDTEK